MKYYIVSSRYKHAPFSRKADRLTHWKALRTIQKIAYLKCMTQGIFPLLILLYNMQMQIS